VGNRGGGTVSSGFTIYVTGGSLLFAYGNGTTGATNTNAAVTYTDNKWHHVVMNVQRSTTQLNALYFDGVPVASNAGTITGISGNALDMGIGAYWGGSFPFNGSIDDVMIFSRALTATEINASYRNELYALSANITGLPGGRYNYTAYAYDIAGNVNQTEYRNYTINSKPTAPNLYWPDNGNVSVMTRTPNLDWNSSTDADGDAINYTLNLSGGCGSATLYSGINESNRTITTELLTSDECAEWYNWTVVATDGFENSTWSSVFGFKVMPIILLSLENTTVDFGYMILGQQDNTTDDDPMPFILINNGTVVSDIVNITASGNLWERSPSPTDKFQLKVNDSEYGSINMSGSATIWTNVSTSNITIISSLNYTDAKDSARIDLRIEVPTDEPPGEKTVDLTFYGAQT
jgi:hypothetical protein